MSSGTTVVGAVRYDASIDLDQLRSSLKKADKLVEESYKKQAASAKKISKASATSSNTSSSGGSTAAVAQARIDAIKKESEAAASSIAKYTPQIQRQFLTVERANNAVYNATQRSSAAIQKYGVDSVQAQRATSALNVAVQAQSQAQARLDNSLKNTNSSLELGAGAALALKSGLIAAGAAIALNLNNAVSRLDTLNNFPKVMSNFGISAEDGEFAIKALSEQLKGLPTSLDAAAQSVQRFTSVNKDVKASTALFLGFNNAVIAGGANAMLQATAIEQMSQAYSRGKFELQEWRSLLVAMPAQLDQVAKAMGFVSESQLYEAMQQNKVSVDDFLLTVAKMNTQGVGEFKSFRDQAVDAVGGVGTSLTNMNTAIVRSVEGMLNSIGTDNLKTIIGGVADLFEYFGRGVAGATTLVKAVGPAGFAAAAGVTAFSYSLYATRNASGAAAKGVLLLNGAFNVLKRHPIIFALGLIVTGLTAAGIATSKLGDETEEAANISSELENSLKNYAPPLRSATSEAANLAKQMAKIAEQADQVREDYRYSLAQLVAEKNKNIATLTQTLSEEEQAYNNAYNERLSSFNKTQNEELLTHQQKTRALQNQIDFLTKYNTAANKKQLSELQFALARENAEYQKSTELRQSEFDAQTESAKDEYEKRRAENQKKLNEELALLNKHRDEVLSVRNVMLLDEIETLRKSRDEQLRSLQQQRNDLVSQMGSTGAAIGNTLGSSFSHTLKESIRIGIDEASKYFKDAFNYKPGFYKQTYQAPDGTKSTLYVPGFSSGGYTGRGDKNDVAGIVHSGEYVLPKEQVNQATGQPDWSKIGGGGSTNNYNFDFSNAIIPTDKPGMRNFANQLAKLMNESAKAKTGKIAIQGI